MNKVGMCFSFLAVFVLSVVATPKYLIFDEDNDHYFKNPPEWMDEAHLNAYVDTLAAGGKVTHVFFCPTGGRASFDSKTWEPIWRGLEEQPREELFFLFRRWAENAKALHDKGIDPYQVWIRRCREKGISPWLSPRMNDAHDGAAYGRKPFRNTTFWRTRRDLRCYPDYDKGSWWHHQFDYSHKEVRESALAMIEELFARYDFDGLNLHANRWFPSETARANIPVMTAFVREVRKIADRWEKTRGHRIGLSVCRAGYTPEDCRDRGFDAAAMAREGLLDIIVCQPDTCAHFSGVLDVAAWRKEIGDAKTAIIAGRGERLFQGDDLGKRRNAGLMNFTAEMFRGWSDQQWTAGADGVYLFNVEYQPKDQREICSTGLMPADIRNQPRSYPCITNCLPIRLDAPRQFRLTVGGERAGTVSAVVAFTEEVAGLDGVTLNGVKPVQVFETTVERENFNECRRGDELYVAVKGPARRFVFPPEAVKTGDNVLSLPAAVGDGAPTLPRTAAVGDGAPTLPSGGEKCAEVCYLELRFDPASSLPRIWTSLGGVKGAADFRNIAEDLVSHGVDVAEAKCGWDVGLRREILSICREKGLRLFLEIADACRSLPAGRVGAPSPTAAALGRVGAPSPTAAALGRVGAPSPTAAALGRVGAPSPTADGGGAPSLPTAEPQNEMAVMIGGNYRGKAIDRTLYRFEAKKHRIVVEPPVYSKGQCYLKFPHYMMMGDGHYYGLYVPTGRAEIIVPEKPFDGKQHLKIIPVTAKRVASDTPLEVDSAVAGRCDCTTEWIRKRPLVELEFDLTGLDAFLLDKVGIAVYWQMDKSDPRFKPWRGCYSLFSKDVAESMRKRVADEIAKWSEANCGTFPSDVLIAARLGDEVFNHTGFLDAEGVGSFPLWGFSASGMKVWEKEFGEGMTYPRTFGAGAIYGELAAAKYLYRYHRAAADYLKPTIEVCHRAGLRTFRNTTRAGCWAYQNDHDGTGQEVLAQTLDILHLDPYPCAKKYQAGTIPGDLSFMKGLSRRFDKPILNWTQAHVFMGLQHPDPETVTRMVDQICRWTPEAMMWLGYNRRNRSSTFPNERPDSWEQAKIEHAKFRTTVPERKRPEIAVVRPYVKRAATAFLGSWKNDPDRALGHLAVELACTKNLDYDVFEVPPVQTPVERAKLAAELERYTTVYSSEPFEGATALPDGLWCRKSQNRVSR